MISGAIGRVVLRYVAGALVFYGVFTEDAGQQFMADPDLALLVGLGISAAVESMYALAKKWGWRL